MRLYTRELYERILPEETGMSCGYMPVGFVELMCDPGRLEYYRRAAALYHHLGGEVAKILPGMVAEQCPIIDTSDVLAARRSRRTLWQIARGCGQGSSASVAARATCPTRRRSTTT